MAGVVGLHHGAKIAVKKYITLGPLGLLYMEYDGNGSFTIVDDGWEDCHSVGLSKENAIRVRDFLIYWLDEVAKIADKGENECL